MKLEIDMLPKGAWNNDLSKTLQKKDWDKIRKICYKRANGVCEICGEKTLDLNAHEIWSFDIAKREQKLLNIVAICNKCHGVIHFRNSVRKGYGEKAKEHFMSVNNCTENDFLNSLLIAKNKYEDRNSVYRWHIKANLKEVIGEEFEINERKIPFIVDPYANIDWRATHYDTQKRLFTIKENESSWYKAPYILSVEVDNYQGVITIEALHYNKIEWFLNGELIKTQHNMAGNRITSFSVEGLDFGELYYVIEGENSSVTSEKYLLKEYKE